MTIRVLLADDEALLRGAFRLFIDNEPDMEVVAEAATGREAVHRARLQQADVVVMDIRMPDMDGLAATRLICGDEALSGVKVLILTTFENDRHVAEALRAGASGFLGKGVTPRNSSTPSTWCTPARCCCPPRPPGRWSHAS